MKIALTGGSEGIGGATLRVLAQQAAWSPAHHRHFGKRKTKKFLKSAVLASAKNSPEEFGIPQP